MLTNFFGKSKPITVLVIFILFFCLFFSAIFTGKIVDEYLTTVLLFFLLFAVVLFINAKNNLSFDNSYVFLVFVLLVGCFPSTFTTNTVFYNNLFLLLFLRKIYSLQSANKTFKKLFDAGFWLGISFIIEPFSLVFGILIYLSVFLHQHLTFQKIIIPILGFLAPTFLFFTYFFWFDKTVEFLKLFDWFTYYNFSLYEQNNFLIPIYFISLLTFIAIITKTPKALAIKNDFRRTWLLLLVNFLCALTLFVLIKNKDGSEFLHLLFPLAIIITNFIEIYEKKWYSDLVIIILMIFSFTTSLI